MHKLSSAEAHELGVRLAMRFKEFGLTQQQLSVKTNINQGQISRILNGQFKSIKGHVIDLYQEAGFAYAKKAEEIGLPPANMRQGELQRAPLSARSSGKSAVLRAFDQVWDGSLPHADRIATLILAAGPLIERSRRKPRNNPGRADDV